MVIRILGAIVGILFLLVAPLMLSSAEYLRDYASAITGIIMGVIFTLYGFTGKKYLSKVFPSGVNERL